MVERAFPGRLCLTADVVIGDGELAVGALDAARHLRPGTLLPASPRQSFSHRFREAATASAMMRKSMMWVASLRV